MSVQTTLLTSPDETYSPPEKVLAVSVVGDRVFLEICDYNETYTDRHTVSDGQFSVNTRELLHALCMAPVYEVS